MCQSLEVRGVFLPYFCLVCESGTIYQIKQSLVLSISDHIGCEPFEVGGFCGVAIKRHPVDYLIEMGPDHIYVGIGQIVAGGSDPGGMGALNHLAGDIVTLELGYLGF